MSGRKILLVEPKYYTQFPPVGLLKFSTYHKRKGDSVQYTHGFTELNYEPDIIYVTSLFTWTWRPVWEVIKQYKSKYPHTKIILGGIYASVMPDHAKYSGAESLSPQRANGTARNVSKIIPNVPPTTEEIDPIPMAAPGRPPFAIG